MHGVKSRELNEAFKNTQCDSHTSAVGYLAVRVNHRGVETPVRQLEAFIPRIAHGRVNPSARKWTVLGVDSGSLLVPDNHLISFISDNIDGVGASACGYVIPLRSEA